MNHASAVASALLNEKAVFIRPHDPFTWTSGIKSPIYCDNRLLISAPKARSIIVDGFVAMIKNMPEQPQVIAGTATAGIPWAAWVADRMSLPMVYVRSSAKEHGRKNMIEGSIAVGSSCVVLEDLISTGKSSLAAVKNLQENGMEVLSILALFQYHFKQAQEIFQKNQIQVQTLCRLEDLLAYAESQGLLSKDQIQEVATWRDSVVFP